MSGVWRRVVLFPVFLQISGRDEGRGVPGTIFFSGAKQLVFAPGEGVYRLRLYIDVGNHGKMGMVNAQVPSRAETPLRLVSAWDKNAQIGCDVNAVDR